MARPKPPKSNAMVASAKRMRHQLGTGAASAQMFAGNRPNDRLDDRNEIVKPWQREAYRQVNICGEARYAASLFAALAGRAEIGVSEPQTLNRKAVWVKSGPDVEAFAQIAPDVRARSKLIRDYMIHYVIAGECYLVCRKRRETDPEGPDELWEIVAVTEIHRHGDYWKIKHDNNNWIDLTPDEPVIRLWNPDPENRREAWSPFRSLIPTLREIEWFTKHIFTQVQSRLMSAGIWFLPNNLTFPDPPPSMINGGADAIAQMNDAERFMASLAASAMRMLDADEVGMPSVVLADPAALAEVDQSKLIKFWSEIDDKAMIMRSDAVRRFALGMDLPPEQVLGSSGLAVTGAGGSAGSVNHWGVWANEEQTISSHIEPALDVLASGLTDVLRKAIETINVIAYDTATLRLRQDRSKESMELYDRGLLKGEVAVRENGFDPETDMMSEQEHKVWLLNRIVSGTATPEQVQAAMYLLTGVDLPSGEQAEEPAPGIPGRNEPRSLEEHPYEGPPREQHDHTEAPFSALHAAAEVLVLRALEKSGNRLLNEGKRGKDRDRTTPPLLAHLVASPETPPSFDFSLVSSVFGALPASDQAAITIALTRFCGRLYENREPYSREALMQALEG